MMVVLMGSYLNTTRLHTYQTYLYKLGARVQSSGMHKCILSVIQVFIGTEGVV